MKINKKKLLTIAAASALALCMAFTMTACGEEDSNDKAPAEVGGSSQDETESTEAQASDYNISEGLSLSEEGDNAILKGNGFTLTMPNTGTWSYRADGDNSLTIYYLTADEAGDGGSLMTIMAFDEGNTTYEDFPDYTLLGTSESTGMTFVALFPTDVQYDPSDETQSEEYMALYDHLQVVNDGGGQGPFAVN